MALKGIDKEKLYKSIKDAAQCSQAYMAMMALSTIVAAVGLYQNSVALIIGAMVIAPLLGPNIASALSTTLGDFSLMRRSCLTSLAGIGIVMALSMIIGVLVQVNPEVTEVASRTKVGMGYFAVALASGCAGALAFISGMSATLIGAMVAVAILPPLVTFGLLLGSGLPSLAMGALALFVMNLICVNLASAVTFLANGFYPASWWVKDRAAKATRVAIVLWAALLAISIAFLFLLRKGWI